eukprot:60215_1
MTSISTPIANNTQMNFSYPEPPTSIVSPKQDINNPLLVDINYNNSNEPLISIISATQNNQTQQQQRLKEEQAIEAKRRRLENERLEQEKLEQEILYKQQLE